MFQGIRGNSSWLILLLLLLWPRCRVHLGRRSTVLARMRLRWRAAILTRMSLGRGAAILTRMSLRRRAAILTLMSLGRWAAILTRMSLGLRTTVLARMNLRRRAAIGPGHLRRRTTILTRMHSSRLVISDDLTTLINRRRAMRLRTGLLSRSPRALLLLRLRESRLLSRVLLCSSLGGHVMRLDTLQGSGACDASGSIAGLDVRGGLLAWSDDRSFWWRGRATLGAGCRCGTDAIERALWGL